MGFYVTENFCACFENKGIFYDIFIRSVTIGVL